MPPPTAMRAVPRSTPAWDSASRIRSTLRSRLARSPEATCMIDCERERRQDVAGQPSAVADRRSRILPGVHRRGGRRPSRGVSWRVPPGDGAGRRHRTDDAPTFEDQRVRSARAPPMPGCPMPRSERRRCGRQTCAPRASEPSSRAGRAERSDATPDRPPGAGRCGPVARRATPQCRPPTATTGSSGPGPCHRRSR